jgi:hypothetical protein
LIRNIHKEMNLLVTVMRLVDDVLTTEVERLIVNGMTTAIIRHTDKVSPQKKWSL